MSSELEGRLRTALAGSYRVDRELGRGGMAIVYLAEDVRHRRPVAIKVLTPNLAGAIESARFHREIEIAAPLSHPNIVPLYDSGEVDGLLYYVMPYVEGESLRDRLNRERQLSIEAALQITRGAADALDHAHALGLVHRDIKPENILVRSGHALVTDFGIARAIDGTGVRSLTGTGLAVGTSAYMSPEQASGDQALDGRTDVYSLACVVYEMLAGEAPWVAVTPQALLAKKMVERVPRVRVVRDTVPAAVDDVLARALAKVPADRFATAGEFVDALERAFARPARAGVRSGASRLRRVAGTIAGLAALLVGGLWATRESPSGTGAQPGEQVRSIAVLPLEDLSGQEDQEYFAAGLHRAMIGELSRVPSLRVISRTSVMRYRADDRPAVPELARELGVDGILEGSVLRSGDSVHIQVQLTQARPVERSLWANGYDAHLRQILAVHRAIAGEIADHLGIGPVQVDGRAPRPRNVDPRAHEAYLRGMFHLGNYGPEGFERGLQYLHEATSIDPADPLPWAYLAEGYSVVGHDTDPRAFRRAKAAAERSLQLDSTVAQAHDVLGRLALYQEYDAPTAARSFERALRLNPSLAATWYHYAWALSVLGRRDEAIEAHRQAEQLDPLTAAWPSSLGWLHWWHDGTPDAVAAAARRALELNPQFSQAHYLLGVSLMAEGKHAEAVVAQERLRESVYWYGLGRAYALAGRREAAYELVARIEREPGAMDMWGLAEVYAALGESDRAIEWLARAYEARFAWLPWIRTNPNFATLHGEPEFEALARRVSAPEPLQ